MCISPSHSHLPSQDSVILAAVIFGSSSVNTRPPLQLPWEGKRENGESCMSVSLAWKWTSSIISLVRTSPHGSTQRQGSWEVQSPMCWEGEEVYWWTKFCLKPKPKVCPWHSGPMRGIPSLQPQPASIVWECPLSDFAGHTWSHHITAVGPCCSTKLHHLQSFLIVHWFTKFPKHHKEVGRAVIHRPPFLAQETEIRKVTRLDMLKASNWNTQTITYVFESSPIHPTFCNFRIWKDHSFPQKISLWPAR